MKPQKWLAIHGAFTEDKDAVTFKGGKTDIGFAVGNFVNDVRFGGGEISAVFRFLGSAGESAGGVILYYDPPTGGFVEVQIGGPTLCSVSTFVSGKWTIHDGRGSAGQITPDVDYSLSAQVTGSRVLVTLDGIATIETNLGFPLPMGHTGIWAVGPNDISISAFDVRREQPKLFVIMQYSQPFNDLYSEVIQPIASAEGFSVVRADEQVGPGLIISDIERQLVNSSVVIADITPANPNVYWEVGYAHALRKPMILVAERDTMLPFDVSAFRTLYCENTIGGKARIEGELKTHLSAVQAAWLATP